MELTTERSIEVRGKRHLYHLWKRSFPQEQRMCETGGIVQLSINNALKGLQKLQQKLEQYVFWI